MGVRLKSKLPFRHAYADSFRCRRDERNRLSVGSACSHMRSHSETGKSGSQVARPALKWFFQVWIARSAALRRWTWGGTNW